MVGLRYKTNLITTQINLQLADHLTLIIKINNNIIQVHLSWPKARLNPHDFGPFMIIQQLNSSKDLLRTRASVLSSKHVCEHLPALALILDFTLFYQ